MEAISRKLGDWLEAYREFSWETESAVIYKKWTAISVLSSVLRRRVFFKLGILSPTFPNFIIIFVGPPGTRKSEALSFGFRLIKPIKDDREIFLSADSTTRQSLIQDIESSRQDIIQEDGTVYSHCSMTVVSKELEVFLGSKKDNATLIALLTDLWDCPEEWEYRTKHAGKFKIPNVFLNIIGATTPVSLAESLPHQAQGKGFTSRIVFCFDDKKHKDVAYPEETKETKKLREYLIHDLMIIALMKGEFKFTPEAREFWDWWYYKKNKGARICNDPSFAEWYERKQAFLIKLSMIIAASRSGETIILPEHLERGLEYLEEVEHHMVRSFSAMGRSDQAIETERVMNIIKIHKKISEKELMSMVWSDLSAPKLREVLDTILLTGKIKRSASGANIYYFWIGGEK